MACPGRQPPNTLPRDPLALLAFSAGSADPDMIERALNYRRALVLQLHQEIDHLINARAELAAAARKGDGR